MERNEYEGKLHAVLLKQFTEMYTRYKREHDLDGMTELCETLLDCYKNAVDGIAILSGEK